MSEDADFDHPSRPVRSKGKSNLGNLFAGGGGKEDDSLSYTRPKEQVKDRKEDKAPAASASVVLVAAAVHCYKL